MWRFQLGIRLLFIVIYARESFCLSANERSGEEKGSSSAPTLSSFQQYTNAIPSDQPVTPHGRRDVEASVKAYSWPSTIFSPLCEAWAYFESSIGNTKSTESNSNSLSWKYLDALVERGGVDALNNWIDDQSKEEQSPWTFDNSTALAIEIASQITQSNETSHTLDRQLLPMALSLRAHSPHCEMHRSLARDAAIVYGLYDVEKGNLPPSAFCLLSRRDGDNNIIGTQLVIDESLLTKALEELNSLESSGENVEHEDSHLLTQLPGESIHLTTSSDEFVAILYGQVGTSAFASLYKSLRNSQLHLIVRHMGFIPYEENNDASVAFPTVMQGYGVRLDIRNVEYKAFDDGPADDSKGGDAKSDWNEAGHHPEQSARDEYLGGLDLHTILDRLQVDSTKPLATDIHALQTAAIRSHSFQLGSESIIPPAWQRRSLSMQAASLIVSSPDPLEALKGVSQNLPSVAHSLSNIQISEEFEALAEKATDLAAKVGAVSPGWGDAAFGFYVNSREVNVERPSFNVFQLLNVLREEDAILRNLELSVRPSLKKAALVLGSDEDEGSSAEWAALQSVRKMMDMGADKLAEIGKSGDFSMMNPMTNESNEEDEIESDFDEEEGSQIYRIDVGRGGKNAVLYLNDIEKDPEYSSWPTSMQQMLYSAQFGGAPTVRRNLFTMLLVIDPADGNPCPALGAVAQLLNAQFPLRLGVLIVNKDDVEKGLLSEPLPWDNGDRPFHASDSFLLLKHITNKYGGMVAISCLFQLLHESAKMDDTISVKEYVSAHVSLFVQMGVLHQGLISNVQDELMNILKTGKDPENANSKNKNLGYESAVQFAKDKLIRPGMSFFNGIPLPGDAATFESRVNTILRDEQHHIMELAMKGVITDSTPKSIYATILSGDNLFNQYHPLLDESSGEYFIASPKSDEASLLLLSQSKENYSNIDALFVIEAMVDLDDSAGIDAVSSFLEVISSAPDHSWHESKTVSLAARIVPTGESTSSASQVLGSLFHTASSFDAADLKVVVDHIQQAKLEDAVDSNFFDKVEGLSASVRRKMAAAMEGKQCHGANHDSKNLYTANGRVYVPNGSPLITLDDIKMLVSLELDQTTAITKLILKNLPSVSASNDDSLTGRVLHHAISRSAAALNDFFSSSTKSEGVSSALTADLDSSSPDENPLFFSWNKDTASESFQVEVSVILDPLTEPTQRVAPLLLAIRDVLKLPLRLIIAPRHVVGNDVPLSSYYRFVVDPLASASNPPKARFENLPTNHLLTLRMDVPEPWDVQQAHGVQDADNLRCDARFGCGDEGYILARDNRAEGSVHIKPTKGLVELTQIDYNLKSLLLFGQCYDVSKNTPPNGLQLTLDRMSLDETEVAEISVEPDGSIGSQVNNIRPSSDHADTLVMKTAGYFQLRSNPGVWSLRIEEKSRGSEIYHLVDGKVSASGQVSPAKSSIERKSKTLVANDFTSPFRVLLVKRKKGFEKAKLYLDEVDSTVVDKGSNETVHVFSLATGHAYERLLKIMMLSVTKRTSAPVKFWLFSNFLSPSFKSSATYMAEQIGCEVEFVTYKWPEWLRGQSEKQRIIWGYKILFLDVLFPLDVKKIIYVDADQVVRGDLTELWNLDLDGAPYGYTPFCDSREETLGYQFWRTGFWKSHLAGKPYHISALYVVDLERFRRELVGDKLRSIYQQLSADPNSLANLDQDLPNYAQHDVRIFSLPQKWLWCESWCSDETKAEAMTIDLCNNPEHKEAKISMAKRIISGDLFEESWEELDEMVRNYDDEFSQFELTKL